MRNFFSTSLEVWPDENSLQSNQEQGRRWGGGQRKLVSYTWKPAGITRESLSYATERASAEMGHYRNGRQDASRFRTTQWQEQRVAKLTAWSMQWSYFCIKTHHDIEEFIEVWQEMKAWNPRSCQESRNKMHWRGYRMGAIDTLCNVGNVLNMTMWAANSISASDLSMLNNYAEAIFERKFVLRQKIITSKTIFTK